MITPFSSDNSLRQFQEAKGSWVKSLCEIIVAS